MDSPVLDDKRKQSIASKSNFSRKSKNSTASRATETFVKKDPSRAEMLAMIGGSPQRTSQVNRNSKTPAPRINRRPDRYDENTPLSEIRTALINDGVR